MVLNTVGEYLQERRQTAADQRDNRDDYSLVMMPHVAVMHPQPSLGLSLLHGILQQSGQRGRVVYGNLLFYKICGLKKANDIFSVGDAMLGSWMFAHRIADNLNKPAAMENYIDYLRQTMPVYLLFEKELIRKNLTECRQIADDLLTAVTGEILSRRPRIVGCSITHTQLVPALALLEKIRELDPTVVTVLGGSNCETIMGRTIHQQFPWVDYCVSGEADDIISPLFAAMIRWGREIPREQLPMGVFAPCHRQQGEYPEELGWRATKENLDHSPPPNYDDFFQMLELLPEVNEYLRPSLPFESSRGCWWAQKKPCAFCSVNGMSRVFRSRPYQQVLAEMAGLHQRYHIDRFLATDSILDMKYFQNLLPALKEQGSPYRIFYQTTALLNKDQLRVMSEAGVRGGQFGIESLATPALLAMNKNVSSWHNVQVLKWCHEFGVLPLWLFLHGFPGEEDAWYQETATLVPLLTHLPPPNGLTPVILFRDSVFFDRAAEFGLRVEPSPAYQHVLPAMGAALQDLAFHFGVVSQAADGGSEPPARPAFGVVGKEVNRWIAAAKKDKPVLIWHLDGENLCIRDTRPVRVQEDFSLTGLTRQIYQYCDAAPREGELYKFFQEQGAAADAVRAILTTLQDDKLLAVLDGRLLALAVPADSKAMADKEDNPFGVVKLKEAMIREIGQKKTADQPLSSGP